MTGVKGSPVYTFVGVLSANDVTLEDIARLAGHSGTAVTEHVRA